MKHINVNKIKNMNLKGSLNVNAGQIPTSDSNQGEGNRRADRNYRRAARQFSQDEKLLKRQAQHAKEDLLQSGDTGAIYPNVVAPQIDVPEPHVPNPEQDVPEIPHPTKQE